MTILLDGKQHREHREHRDARHAGNLLSYCYWSCSQSSDPRSFSETCKYHPLKGLFGADERVTFKRCLCTALQNSHCGTHSPHFTCTCSTVRGRQRDAHFMVYVLPTLRNVTSEDFSFLGYDAVLIRTYIPTYYV